MPVCVGVLQSQRAMLGCKAMEQCLSVAVFYRARGQCWEVGHGAMPVCVGVLQSQRAMLGGRPRSNACLCRCSTEPEGNAGR